MNSWTEGNGFDASEQLGASECEKNLNPTVFQPDGCNSVVFKKGSTHWQHIIASKEGKIQSYPISSFFLAWVPEGSLLPDSLDVKLSQTFITP